MHDFKKPFIVINGDSLIELDKMNENSIDSIVTDPPYGLVSITKRFGKENSSPAKEGKDGSFARLSKGFMGKAWDGSGIEYNVDLWKKALRVLKPGAYLLAFGGTRTFHRIACAIEDAGFEIRDTIMWLYGSGFPKSHNVALSIDKMLGEANRGHRVATASRNHPDGTFEPNGDDLPPYEAKQEEAKQWQGWGTALKPAYEPIIVARKQLKGTVAQNVMKYGVGAINIDECRVETESQTHDIGRFPANFIHDGSDEVTSKFPSTEAGGSLSKEYQDNAPLYGDYGMKPTFESYGDNGNASRFFYTAKASKKDRDDGLKINKNIHPTVKPTELMQYLVRLVTPKGGVVLDIFNGSGGTGKACMFENRERNADYKYIGIELDIDYCKISEARIDYALNKHQYDILEEIEENKKKGQLTLFDD